MKIYTKDQFLDKHPNEHLYKLLNKDLKYSSITYSEGLNMSINLFGPEWNHGLCFYTETQLINNNLYNNLCFIADVELCEDSMVTVDKYNHKTDKFILYNIRKFDFNNLGLYINFNNEKICKKVVEIDGRNLKYIPRQFQSVELCRLAVEQNGWCIRLVPEEFRTIEICETAIKQHGCTLEYTQQHIKTIELCKNAVTNDGFSLEFVPRHLKNKEMCEIAVKKNGYSLEFVPRYLRTKEICKIAVKQDANALQFVPINLRINIKTS